MYWGLFYTLKPFKPFERVAGDDVDKGFKFLTLLAHRVIKQKISDVEVIKNTIADWVLEQVNTASN